MTRNVVIKAQAGGPHSLTVDGHDISKGVRSLALDIERGSLPMLSIDLAVFEVTDVEGPARLLIPDGTRDALVAMGWTPPEDQR